MAELPTGGMANTISIERVLAPNAGRFTGEGTNTWLVGDRALAIIDPGPADPRHLAAIIAAAAKRPVTHILLTHAHRDHSDGITALKRETGAVVRAMPRDPPNHHRSDDQTPSPSGADFIAWDVPIDLALAHGDTFNAGDAAFVAVHTPGHAPDHLCFALSGSGVLFSGDHVMGWSTSVIAPPEGHMGRYLDSLEAVLARPEVRYLPGHGGEIADGRRTAKTYLIHRQMRERAVIEALRSGARTPNAIAAIVYAGLDPAIWPAAVLSVQAHVELLVEKGLVISSGPVTSERPLALSS